MIFFEVGVFLSIFVHLCSTVSVGWIIVLICQGVNFNWVIAVWWCTFASKRRYYAVRQCNLAAWPCNLAAWPCKFASRWRVFLRLNDARYGVRRMAWSHTHLVDKTTRLWTAFLPLTGARWLRKMDHPFGILSDILNNIILFLLNLLLMTRGRLFILCMLYVVILFWVNNFVKRKKKNS